LRASADDAAGLERVVQTNEVNNVISAQRVVPQIKGAIPVKKQIVLVHLSGVIAEWRI
jgi:hypothetical protein